MIKDSIKTDLRREHFSKFVQASVNIFSTCQEDKDIARTLLNCDDKKSNGTFSSADERTNLEINIPNNLSCFANVVFGWFLKVCNFNRVCATLQTNDSGFIRRLIMCEVIQKVGSVQSCR